MQVTRLELRDFRNYEAAELALPAGLTVVVGPTAPARPTCSRPSTSAAPAPRRAPRTSASWFAAAPTVAARGDRDARRRGEPPDRGRLPARRGQAPARRRQRRRQPRDPRRAPARERLPARAARAREGRAGRAAGPTSTRSSPRSGPPAPARAPPTRARSPSATRCSAASAPALAGPGALDAWDAELAREGIALMERPRARPSRACRTPFARLARAARPAGRRRAALPAALATPSDAAGLAAELAERRDADLERGFTAHGPHRDELLLAAGRARRCAPTARRASSAPRCSRCCSPSASCWPRAAAARR